MSPLGITVTDPPAHRYVAGGGFVSDCDAKDLIYFVLNVGDGDSQVVLLPDSGNGRSVVVVDVCRYGKTDALIQALIQANLLPANPHIALLVATHPHSDHIGGIPKFLENYGAQIDEIWEPGYFHTSDTFAAMLKQIAAQPVRHGQPTSGMTRWIGQAKVVALSPGINLRNRYDTYGVDTNNASITLRIEFPGRHLTERKADGTYKKSLRRTLILGADAQMLAWAQVMMDFPQLEGSDAPLAKALSALHGFEPLQAEVLKVPHHASKHGLNLELIKAIRPRLCLVSCQRGGTTNNFPHRVAIEALREAREPRARTGAPHSPDWQLGIHYTFDRDTNQQLLGSIALVMSPGFTKSRLWRFGDTSIQNANLSNGRVLM